jgi:sigma-E factor negative regulatory protein RseA
MNLDDRDDRLQWRQALSALMDGDGSEAEQACRAWRDDAGARADWHAYHLIGELMRSEDARCTPQRDAQFLGCLRERLVGEPVVLAPAALPRQMPWHRGWAAPVAVAAGFVAVVGVLVVTRVAAPDVATQDRAALLASSIAAPAASATGMLQAAARTPLASSAPGSQAVEGVLIRNAELDRYLAAHKQYSNTSALAAPGGGMVRNTAAVAPGR